MRNHKRTYVGAVVGIVVLGSLAGGCGTALATGDSSSILDMLSQYGITEDMTITDVLNQLTVGDVVTAFVDFADSAALGHGLTDEQLSELESLQAQLDAGEISQDEFDNSVRELIGDRGAGMPFAGFDFYGGPFGHQMDFGGAAFLDLTEEQQTAAEEIFQNAHDDIDALRSAAQDEIRALLTEDQLAILDEMGLPADGEGPFHGGFGPGGSRGHGGFGPGDFGPQSFADELGLTGEQQTAIDEIRSELRDAIQARHEQARQEFLDLLTEEQLAQLDLTTETSE